MASEEAAIEAGGREHSSDVNRGAAAAASVRRYDETGNRGIEMSHRHHHLCQLAQKACDAMKRDDTSELYSVLGLVGADDDEDNVVNEGESAAAAAASSNRKPCHDLRRVYYSLIGHQDDDDDERYLGELSIPLTVKAHLLLRALLRIRHDKYSIPWEAANAAIQSLQYSDIKTNTHTGNSYNQSNKKSTLSHGEELAMVAEIRSFVTSLRIEKEITKDGVILRQTVKHLTELAMTILSPLRMNEMEKNESLAGGQGSDMNTYTKGETRRRLRNSYALPLELIPAIFATTDSLDDMLVHLTMESEINAKHENNDYATIGDHASSMEGVKTIEEDEGPVHIRASDNILSSMFATYTDDVGGDRNSIGHFHRTMRADAGLHLLSLAMDDIGFSRMSTTLMINAEVTYWDCLKFELSDIIRSNLVCYSGDHASSPAIVVDDSRQQIVDVAILDEGAHIIPPSDYPALMRRIFRMVATDASSNVPHRLSWESILLRLYHAAAVATAQIPLESVRRVKKSSTEDRLATLSTVESHVLLPSFTGASVSTIKSILETCNLECCQSCKRDAADWKLYSNHDNYAVPVWAIAGIALLVMRARSSDLSHSSSSTRSGPRVVFRMAKDMLRKSTTGSTSENKSNNPTDIGGDDEVGYALKVLLRLSGVGDGICRSCCIGVPNENAEKCAYDVLKHSYYAGNGIFSHRYLGLGTGSELYQDQRGCQILSSYSNLVRASLCHGTLRDGRKHCSIDSSTADTARTWLDAANMLLDHSNNSPTTRKGSSITPDGTAMAIVIITVVFFEVPSSQDEIVRSIYNRLASMVSHHSQSIGTQSDESCFVLLSNLTWSLLTSDGNYSSINVVRRNGDRFQEDHMKSVMGPICNLLSKSALPQYQNPSRILPGANRETPHISYWAMRQLVYALAPTPNGREVILAIAQKNMSALSTSSPYSQSISSFESHQSAPCLAIDCLCALIEKCHLLKKSSTDDSGRIALGMLTGIIVLQCPLSFPGSRLTPCLTNDVLSWMFCKLSKSARLGKFTKWTSQRLLRACFLGLFAFIRLEESSDLANYSSYLLPGKIFSTSYSSPAMMHKAGATSPAKSVTFQARNDVPGMFQLVVSLYNDIAKVHGNKRCAATQPFVEIPTLVKAHLLETLLNRPVVEFESNESVHARINQLFKDCGDVLERGFDPTRESADFIIDGITLIILVQGAARMIQKQQSGSPTSIDTTASRKIVTYLCNSERHCYQEGHPSLLPHWIETSNRFIDGRDRYFDSIPQLDETLLDCVPFNLFQSSLCDSLVEILLQNCEQHDNQAEMEIRHCELPILLGVNSVLGWKRQINESLTGSSVSAPLLGKMSENSICSLLELSSQRLHLLLNIHEDKKALLPELNLLVNNILDLCHNIPEGVSSPGRFLSSIWSLYCSLVDEQSSQVLSLVVKEFYVTVGKWEDVATASDLSDWTFSLLSITSSDDLDYHVRYLRCEVLLALSQVLTLVTTRQTESSPEERKASLDLLLQILPQICQDLDASFQGQSGGISKSLFLIFLDAIDKCLDAMAAFFESLPLFYDDHQMRSFVSTHWAAAEFLWVVFCENPLTQATVIKGTLRLCIDKMPIMVLKAENVVQDCLISKQPSEHTVGLLDRCISYLMSKPKGKEAKERMNSSKAASGAEESAKAASGAEESVNFIGIERADGTKIGLTKSAEEGGEEDLGAPRVENFCKGFEGKSKVPLEQARMPNITREDTMTWACNCALAAITNVWKESYQIIAGRRLSKHNPRKRLNSLALRRIEGLSHLHTSICRLFEERVGVDHESNEDAEESSKILAELLTERGKSNVCSCIEKMTMTLNLSVKQVIKYLKESTCLMPLNETRLNESLICIKGWLRSVTTKETKHSMITGPLQWYLNEKRNCNLISDESNCDGSSILGRLPKVLLRLEGLDADLRKLVEILADLSWRNDFISKEKMIILNQIENNNGFDERNTFESLLRQGFEVVDSCKKLMQMGGTLLDEDEFDSDVEGNLFSLTGKRPKYRLAPMRKSRRVLLRSRNETIDNWLTMDDDEKPPEEKYNNDDAFVDLEDFLVEG